MDDRKVLATGAAGSVVAAICCFTPALVIGLGAVGLSAWLGWIDYVLFPALALFPRHRRLRPRSAPPPGPGLLRHRPAGA